MTPIDVDALMEAIRGELGVPAPETAARAQGHAPLDRGELMARVRDEVRRRAGGPDASSPLPESRSSGTGEIEHWQPAAVRLPTKTEYALHELLSYSDGDFVDVAYRLLFRRTPDEAGFRHYLAELRSGRMSKVEVLGTLRWSDEGKARSVHVDGLLVPYAISRLGKVVVVGPMLRWLKSFLRLHRLADRQLQLDALHSRESYEIGQLLNRVIDQVHARVAGVEDAVTHVAEDGQAHAMQVTSVQRQVGQLESLLAKLDERYEATARREELAELQRTLASAVARAVANLDKLAAEQSQLRASIHEQRDSIAPIVQRERDAEASERALDSLYSDFEERFRGLREVIRARVEPYLQIVLAAGAGTAAAPVVDLGSGRGEWLGLLGEHGLVARGIDNNRVFLEKTRREGLDVIEGDAIDALAAMPDGSVGAVTSFHLVEHLPFDRMIKLIDEARRVLQTGGVLILETPNPENLSVASHWFYLDPTHRNPIPPEALRWLVQARGFDDVAIERLTLARELDAPPLLPTEHPDAGSINPMISMLGAAPDYAIVAWRK